MNAAVKDHFSRMAEQGVWASLYQPDEQITAANFSFLIRARRVMELIQSSGPNPKEVVDVGCGSAPLGNAMVSMGANYTGVDFSGEMIESAREVMKDSLAVHHVELKVGDATQLDLSDASFDCAVAMGLIEYFTVEAAQVVVNELARVLTPGGIAVITIPKRWSWHTVVNAALTPVRKAIRWRYQSAKWKLAREQGFRRLLLTPGELDGLCRNAGLGKIGQRHYNFQLAAGPIVSIAPRTTYLINRPFEPIARVPGGGFFATGYIGMYRRPN